MLWWKSILAIVKVVVVSNIYSSNTDRNNTNIDVNMESNDFNSTSKLTRTVETHQEQNSVEAVNASSVSATTVTANATSTDTNHVVTRKSIRRTNDDVVDEIAKNYYIHPHAGYVSRTNNIMNYKCQWQNYHGSMIAGSKAIVFQGSFFLFDKTFILSWDNIRQVVLIDPASSSSSGSNMNGGRSNSNNNNNSNSGIEIIMSDETVHSFMMNQQQQSFGTTATTTTKVWLSLLSLHNDALLGRKHVDIQTTTTTTGNRKVDSETTTITTPRSYERRNSDPAKSSILMSPDFIFEEEDIDDDDDNNNSSTPLLTTTTTVLSTMTEQIPIETIMVHAGSPLRLQPIHCTYMGSNQHDVNSESKKVIELSMTETDGRLYIGNDAIIFIGTKKPLRRNYFASTWEHFIVALPWTTVLRINHKLDDNETNGTQNQIGVRIRTKGDSIIGGVVAEEKIFDFGGIETPEQVWASLVAIHNEKLLQLSAIGSKNTPKHDPSPLGVSILSGSKTTVGHRTNRDVISSSNRRKSHRRTNSDPMMASIQINFDNYQVLQDEYNSSENKDAVEVLSSNITDKATAATVENEVKQPLITVNGTTYNDMWLSMKNQSVNNVYSNVVIDNKVIENCTLDQFYDAFMNNNAIYSMDRFLTGRGDFDVRTSDWEEDINAVKAATTTEPSNVGGWKQYKRVIKYMHPVNVPLAPPQAAARKEQVLTRYDNVGICIVTQTFVDDVPMTDCFYVADRMLVEPSSSTPRGITVRMEFGITFVKSTMFKGIISKKTTAEFIELFNALAQYISQSIVDKNSAPIVEEVVKAKNLTSNEEETLAAQKVEQSHDRHDTIKSTSKHFYSVDRMILLFLAIIQFWILIELKGMKLAIIMLEQQQQRNNVLTPNDYTLTE